MTSRDRSRHYYSLLDADARTYTDAGPLCELQLGDLV